MRVKYVHASDPNKVKVYDIEEAYRKCPFLDLSNHPTLDVPSVETIGGYATFLELSNRPTLDDWTRMELDHFASDKKKGIILTYEICE